MEEEFIDMRNLQQHLERSIARLKADETISSRNKELILNFVRDAALGKTIIGRAKKKIGPARQLGYIAQLRPLIDYLHTDLDQITQSQMEDFIEALESGKFLSRTRHIYGKRKSRILPGQYSLRYKVDIKVTIKKFYKWLMGESKTYPKSA